jgi:hypothetical protein
MADGAGRVRVQVHEDEKYPFYSVMFREDLEEWEDDDDFEPNAELSEDEVADFRRVQAEQEAWQAKLAKIHEAVRRKQMRQNRAAAAVRRAGLHLVITLEDGTEGAVVPVVTEDGSAWTYLVPEGVSMVGGSPVHPGDTVSGKIEISPW